MFVYIEDEIIELENDSKKVKEYLRIISEKLKSKESKLEYLVVDGHIIYADFEKYLVENIGEIKKVVVVTDTTRHLVGDTIDTSQAYIQNALPLIQELGNGFYANLDEKIWLTLVDLLEGIQWILQAVIKIDGVKNLESYLLDYKIWNEYVQIVSELSIIIPDLQEAMENQDNVLIGDLLLYEISPVFEKMIGCLGFLVKKEGDVNVS